MTPIVVGSGFLHFEFVVSWSSGLCPLVACNVFLIVNFYYKLSHCVTS